MRATSSIKSIWHDVVAYRRVYFLTFVAAFGGMLFGWDTGLIGGVLTMPSFQASFGLDSHNDPTGFANLSGNIVSVLQAGCFFGAGASFYVSDRLGRKRALLLADAIFLIGSVVQTTCAGSGKLAQLYVGRVIGGFGVGLISAVVPTYIAENANKEIRGRCIGAMQLFNVTGICLSFFVNYGVSISIPSTSASQWQLPFALQMLPGVILFVGLFFQNESPRWLVEKNRLDDARTALARVRAKSLDDPSVGAEFEEIVVDFNSHERMTLMRQMREVCSSMRVFYTFGLAVSLMFWQQWTGTNSINYYAPQIFQAVGLGSDQSKLFATGIYGVVKIVFTALALMFAVEQLGRKWSLIIGGLGQAFAMYYIGVNQAVNPVKPGDALNGHSTFAIVCVYLFVVFYSFAWGSAPFILSSECSPNSVRSLNMAAALMTQWLFNFVIAKLTPLMLNGITYGTFLIFGSCCVLMVIFAIIFVPETANVPLESIPRLFADGHIVRGALRDTFPRWSRAAALRNVRNVDAPPSFTIGDGEDGLETGSMRKADLITTSHVESLSPTSR